jgi:hypothetical protein
MTAPQNNWPQNHSSEPRIVTTTPQRVAPQIEQSPIFTPQAPRIVSPPSAPVLPEHSQNRIEQRQNPAPSGPSYTAPAASEVRSAARAERSADRDKKDR